VVAKRHASVKPDTAFLAGLLHGIGRLYILARAAAHPALIADRASYLAIVRDWNSTPSSKTCAGRWTCEPGAL